jgi:hypothetical protein
MNRHLPTRLAGALLGIAIGAGAAAAQGSQEQNAGLPGEWLARYSNARSLGFGSANVAIADDPLGVMWNPAGLSFMNQNELRFENARLFGETSLNSIGFAVPGSRWPSLGVSMVSLSSGDFERTNDVNDPLGTFKEGETAWLLSASKAFTPKLAIGMNVKLVQQSVESFSANGTGVDLGALYQVAPGLKLGASMMNVGGPTLQLRDVAESYPSQFRGGAALGLLQGRGLIALELDHADGLGTQFHAGASTGSSPGWGCAWAGAPTARAAASPTASPRATRSTTRPRTMRWVSSTASASVRTSAVSSPARRPSRRCSRPRASRR